MSVNSPPPPNNSFAWVDQNGKPTVQFFDFMYKLWLNRVGGTNSDEEILLMSGGADDAAISALNAKLNDLHYHSADDLRPLITALVQLVSELDDKISAIEYNGDIAAIKSEMRNIRQDLDTLIG